MNQLVLIMASVAFTASVYAADKVYVIGKPSDGVSKVAAVRKLILDENASVYECTEKAITEKATLRNK